MKLSHSWFFWRTSNVTFKEKLTLKYCKISGMKNTENILFSNPHCTKSIQYIRLKCVHLVMLIVPRQHSIQNWLWWRLQCLATSRVHPVYGSCPYNSLKFTTKFYPILIGLNWSRDAIVFIRGETLGTYSVPFTRENWKLQLEDQIVRAIPFGKLQKTDLGFDLCRGCFSALLSFSYWRV